MIAFSEKAGFVLFLFELIFGGWGGESNLIKNQIIVYSQYLVPLPAKRKGPAVFLGTYEEIV